MTCYHLDARLHNALIATWCPGCQRDVPYHDILEGTRAWMRAEIESLRKAVFGGGSYAFANFAICAGALDVPGLIPQQSRSFFVGQGSEVGVCHLGDTKHYNPEEKITCAVICYGEPYSEEVLLGWDVWPTLQVLTRRAYPLWPDDRWEVRTVRGDWVGDKRFGDLNKDDFPLNVYLKVGHGG